MYHVVEEKRKKKKRTEPEPEEVPLDEPKGETKVMVERRRKKKKPRKNVLPPSTDKVSASMREMEEEPKDMIPLSQRTRATKVVASEKRKSWDTHPLTIEEDLIWVEESTEVEVHEQHPEKEPSNDEFQVEKFYFMPVGTTMEGYRIVDPRFPPLLVGPLGVPTLPSPTPLEEMEEGQIPLLLELEP